MKYLMAAVVLVWVSLATATRAACPEGMVPVPGAEACIDVYEWPNHAGALPLVGASALPEPRDQRAGVVMDAEALCRSAGKRVCTLPEWRAACTYATGASPEEDACNNDRPFRGPVNEARVVRRDAAEMERLDQREASGARAACASVSGARDMVGNVEEWVRCQEGKYGWCLVGRYWSEAWPCTRAVVKHAPRWHYYQTGFRCCWGAR